MQNGQTTLCNFLSYFFALVAPNRSMFHWELELLHCYSIFFPGPQIIVVRASAFSKDIPA